MRIWIDADACPVAVREIVFRASRKRRLPVTLVSDRLQATPNLSWITSVQVKGGMDAADDYIVEHAGPRDLVITHDIPLAAQVIAKGASVLGIRGDTFNASTIAERLAARDFMTEVRAMGMQTGGPPPYDDRARAAFANGFDRWLAAAERTQGGYNGS